jgi:hypothetical protein
VKDPAHYARWVRRVHDVEEELPLDVDALATRCNIHVHDDEFDGFLGLWFTVQGRDAIVLDARQGRRRRRFTLGHELGHACMPSHRASGARQCLDTDLAEADSDRGLEAEANQFAAELLAPRRLVAPLLKTGALDLAKADEIANRFDISLTCAARRVVEHSGQPMALVLSSGGRIIWSVRRHGFPYGLPGRGDPAPPDTIAHSIDRGDGGTLAPRPVSRTAWLPERRGQFTLMESAIRLGMLDQVLSLLWIPDMESADSEDGE